MLPTNHVVWSPGTITELQPKPRLSGCFLRLTLKGVHNFYNNEVHRLSQFATTETGLSKFMMFFWKGDVSQNDLFVHCGNCGMLV